CAGARQPRQRQRRGAAGARAADRWLRAGGFRRGPGTRTAPRRRQLVSTSGSSPQARAALLMLGSTSFFAAMAVTIRLASADLSTYQIAFFRNLFGLLFLLPFLFHGRWQLPRTTQLPRYVLRCAIGVGSMLCGFWALGHLPMAQAVSLSYATPLFATVAAVFILGETVRLRRWSAVLIGLAGVLVIVRPGSADFSLGTLVALAGAGLAALVAIQIKQLSRV